MFCLCAQCRKNKKFIRSYKRNFLELLQTFISQMVKILKYDYTFFAAYVGEMTSIFYETAQTLLNADVANILNNKLPPETLGERMQAAI